MNKRIISFAVLLLFSLAVSAFDRATYYSAANGKKTAALKTAMFGIIKNPKVTTYDGLYEGYKKTDTRADGYVRDWYSKTTKYRHVTDKAGTYKKEGDCYNREHSVPQSWFNVANLKSDIVHVLPTDGYVNNKRSNWPFGEVGSITYRSNEGYCKLGLCCTNGYTGTVFEPGDDIKGDIARIYFYIVTCYEGNSTGFGHNVFSSSTYPGLEKWALDMFIRWAKNDPVDSVEAARNDAVMDVQKNRNPFVDFPGLEQYIWGTYKDVAFNASNYREPYNDGSLENPTAIFAQTRVTLEVGETFTQTVNTNSDGDVTYESNNKRVVEVDAQTGRVKALAAGVATISAFIGQTNAFASTVAAYTVVVKDGDNPGPEPQPLGDVYVKVTSTRDDWTGVYLIVYEPDELALNGDDVSDNNKISVDIKDETIAVTEQTEAAEFTIMPKAGGYSIQGRDGNYIGHTGSKNELSISTENVYSNTLSIVGGNAVISSENFQLFYNKGAGLFRFYKSGQQPIALYRRAEADGIENIANDNANSSNTDVYDLAGRRILRIERPGLYIIRGKKTFVR